METLIRYISLLIFIYLFHEVISLREFRTYSTRPPCEMAQDPNYPFAYSKYFGQSYEFKGLVNSNLQDFRHSCQVHGGRSKCHICEQIECLSDTGYCNLQLQGVNSSQMSQNIPTITNEAWAVGGSHRYDFGGENVTHFCVFLSNFNCTMPTNQNFSQCAVRCFGYGFPLPAKKFIAPKRSAIDVYPGMGRWPNDGKVDLWSFPNNCDELKTLQNETCTYSGQYNKNPSYNPQGVAFTIAGTGQGGFKDGLATTEATFNRPMDLALDEQNWIYVADTDNNAIRVIFPNQTVATIAGKGPQHPGYQDGLCNVATFHKPQGLDVRIELINSIETRVIIVADTGNSRIRRIEYVPSSGYCQVTCLTGLCGNNTLSASLDKTKAYPITGYADGSGLVARFSNPQSVSFVDGDYVVVADTGNFLIRLVIASNGTTYTLAGEVVDGEKGPDGKPVAGCTPPCLVGHQGFRDGNLTYAQFYNPLDVTKGPNNTIWVVDEQRVRIIELPKIVTTLYGIKSTGRVSTIAGDSLQGQLDGIGQKSKFFYSSGIFVTSDNIVYVSDAVSCKVRRISPFPVVAQPLTCDTSADEIIRPSGCTSFDQPLDKVGRKISRVEANIQYNYGWPYSKDLNRGRYIKNCVGIPPHDRLQKKGLNVTLVIENGQTFVNEDSEQGMAILVKCPNSCLTSSTAEVLGDHWYSGLSSVCRAAIHNGVIDNHGGIVQIVLERWDYLKNVSASYSGSFRNGILSSNISDFTHRVFSIQRYNISDVMVHSIAGVPTAPLESGCGFNDAQPPTEAKFNLPSGVAARYNTSLSDDNYLYIADALNNRIRALSASCTQICENGGRCVAPDTCQCPSGWTGIDCTTPICSSPCALNSLCVAPDTCACKPGYQGSNCDIPQCSQQCHNGGFCSAPDTCTCASGWFDTNCTTPVCSQTCANGGNCTAPNTCACPSQWTGNDCRTPVCKQTCLNNGFCVAPNTCACPPQWTNYDCSAPVCTQGFFQSNVGHSNTEPFAVHMRYYPTYKNCDLQSWCNATNEFECDQTEMVYETIRVPSGPEYRAITGRKVPPKQCMEIELPIEFKIPFQLLLSDNATTEYSRYSPFTPYTSNPDNPWRGYTTPTPGHTGPWTYTPDRQIANVNWLNVSQGVYVCANGGTCVSPGVCSCPDGWIGFDCRTPVCKQGYYKSTQHDYVSGAYDASGLATFKKFMGYNSYYLDWPYSNPNYTMEFEYYNGSNQVIREIITFPGKCYYGPLNYSSSDQLISKCQGGYRCSIRANTQWENEHFLFQHPNFYSRYMDRKKQGDGKYYTTWVNFSWPDSYFKSRVLDQHVFNLSFAFTNQGYRRYGVWNLTGVPWEFGLCILQFKRNCSDPTKELDLESGLYNVYVQDTDLSFRPRIKYNDRRVISQGRWKQSTGQCVDFVVRGCANNGTCIAPDVCQCAAGWKGSDCRTPICQQTCHHNGNCTGPNTCTCEKGWSGYDCSTPMCAQECQNFGKCVAPDTCQCKQWPNAFRDGRIAGGRPLFQDENGDPLPSGWTGYDCSVPICVQAEKFLLNVPSASSSGYLSLGGHGGNGLMTCTDTTTGKTLPRCPQYNEYVTGNDGKSFQTGCGWDPYDTGCCIIYDNSVVNCYKCSGQIVKASNHTFYCDGTFTKYVGLTSEKDKFAQFLDKYQNFLICGSYHSPRYHDPTVTPQDYGVAQYYFNVLYPSQSSFNYLSNWTSNRFLCNVDKWVQGDWIDNAGLGNIQGAGSIYGLQNGRHVRINTPNIITNAATQTFKRGPKIYGEGVYQCYNLGSCIGPDKCTCEDGYEGYDCNTPLCRHLQITGAVSSCLNGGICESKDNCNCIQTPSVLWKVHKGLARGLTGWTGTDCSLPMCVQGFYDPYCTDLPQAPGGQGCYRCANGGNCTAPDICTCAKGWTGFDCKTPVCETIADPLTRTQLGTVFESKVIGFESDPCGVVSIYGLHGWHGTKYTRGNCTQPNQCTCLCKVPYNAKACKKSGKYCEGPWQDPLVKVRNLLVNRGPEYTFGSTNCAYGFEGNVDSMERFVTCHQTIYYPTSTERSSLALIIGFSVAGFVMIVFYRYASVRLKRRFLLAKIERRRSKRSSEESLLSAGSGAFVTK